VYYVDKAYKILLTRIYEYQNGGYVGLKIRTRTKVEKQEEKIKRVRELRKILDSTE